MASREASFSTRESLTWTGVQDAVVLMVHTHRGISRSVDRKFSAQIRSLPAANSQVGALRDRSRPKRDTSRVSQAKQHPCRVQTGDVVAYGTGLRAAADEDAAFEVGLHGAAG